MGCNVICNNIECNGICNDIQCNVIHHVYFYFRIKVLYIHIICFVDASVVYFSPSDSALGEQKLKLNNGR